MANNKKIMRSVVAKISKTMVKMANGTASANYIFQPKKPAGLKKDK